LGCPSKLIPNISAASRSGQAAPGNTPVRVARTGFSRGSSVRSSAPYRPASDHRCSTTPKPRSASSTPASQSKNASPAPSRAARAAATQASAGTSTQARAYRSPAETVYAGSAGTVTPAAAIAAARRSPISSGVTPADPTEPARYADPPAHYLSLDRDR
jgi:hypothetical protein